MESFELKPKIEALLIASSRPVSVQALVKCLGATEEEVKSALNDFEADLMGADRGVQIHRRPSGIRLEIKPQFVSLIGALMPERQPKPLSSQAHEVLSIIALKPDISIREIKNVRQAESAWTIHTLSARGLIARSARLGPHREKLWRTTALFLETFGLSSLDELREPGRLEAVMPSIFSAEIGCF